MGAKVIIFCKFLISKFLKGLTHSALVVLVGPQGSGAVIDPQTWWNFRGQEKGSVIKTWDRLLSSSIRNYFGCRTEKSCFIYIYIFLEFLQAKRF